MILDENAWPPHWIEISAGQQLESVWLAIRRVYNLDFVESKQIFLEVLRRLMADGRLLVDMRFDHKAPPWGTVQEEILGWFSQEFPTEEVMDEGLWFIDNFSRPDGEYPGACVWHAAAMNGDDMWA